MGSAGLREVQDFSYSNTAQVPESAFKRRFAYLENAISFPCAITSLKEGGRKEEKDESI